MVLYITPEPACGGCHSCEMQNQSRPNIFRRRRKTDGGGGDDENSAVIARILHRRIQMEYKDDEEEEDDDDDRSMSSDGFEGAGRSKRKNGQVQSI